MNTSIYSNIKFHGLESNIEQRQDDGGPPNIGREA